MSGDRHDELVGHDPFARAPRWSARPAAPGVVRCFGRRLCAETIHPAKYTRDAVLVNGDGGRGRWAFTFGSSIESDAPPWFVALDDIACVRGRFCLIATGSGAIVARRFGAARCKVYDGSDIGCGVVHATVRRSLAQR